MEHKEEPKELTIIGVIPKYPKHTQHNIFAAVKMPPVGIISVLTQIRHEFYVYAVDENNYKGPLDIEGMPDHAVLQKKNPAKIAMFYGGMSNSIPRMFSIAKQYKNFNALTIAGGSHVDALPEEALNSGIDLVVHGEGEVTVKEILNSIIKNGKVVKNYKEKLKRIKGISFLNKRKYVFTGKREPIKDLNRLKDPDLNIIRFMNKKWTSIPISRGRGCNFNCEFCVVNKQYGRYKCISNEKVLRQIEKYSNEGYKNFFFTDDNFAQDTEKTIEICKMIGDYKRELNKKLIIDVQVRTEVAENDEIIEAMRYGGVKTLYIGYESPINEELKAMRKGVTVEKLVERSRKLSKYFYLHGMFIFGYPTFKDSEPKSALTLYQKAKRFIKFFKKAKLDTIQVLNAVPLPGSELRAKLEAEKRILPLGWDKYDGLFLCYIPEEGIDAYELQTLPRILMRKKYLGNIIDRTLNYGNWINWVYNSTIGFPIQFSFFYVKRFVHNLVEKSRENRMDKKEKLLQERNIFHEPLVRSWDDIKREWRSLAIKTYGGEIVRRWLKEYKKSDYRYQLDNLQKNKITINKRFDVQASDNSFQKTY